tara:strand:- start:4724 stop:5119 length:396 start_codon:yes stop_codon:yes gene_type:complete
MSLIIEISFSISKLPNITQLKTILTDLAEKYNSISNYFTHEIEGHNVSIDRNDCIHIVEFSMAKEDILNYIKNVRKIKNVKIDSIYIDDNCINLIYASKKYLSTMSINKCSFLNKSITEDKIIEVINERLN